MKAKDLRDKSIGEREKLLDELREKNRVLRFDIVTRETKNHREYRKNKKDIARLLTLRAEYQTKSE